MGNLFRNNWQRGWVPDANEVNGPNDGLLRMDNCELDELGAVTLRPGSSLLNGNLGGEVKSIYSITINGIKFRIIAAGNFIFAQIGAQAPVQLGGGFAAATGVSFGDYMGHVLIAWSTLKLKWDGSTVRDWGIQTPPTPNASQQVPPPTLTFGLIGVDAANVSAGEGSITYVDDKVGLGGTAPKLTPDATAKRGTLTLLFPNNANFTAYPDGSTGDDQDEFSLHVHVADPNKLTSIEAMVDINGGTFDDYFRFQWKSGEAVSQRLDSNVSSLFDVEGVPRKGVVARTETRPTTISILRQDKPVANTGWTRLSVLRGQFSRVGTTVAKGWNTVRAVRFTIQSETPVTFWLNIMTGSATFPLDGTYRWRVALVHDTGQYQAISPLSPMSSEVTVKKGKINVSVIISANVDFNRIWFYRMGGTLDAFYRVGDLPVGGGGTTTLTDSMSDATAMILNIKANTDVTRPPDNIVDIEGPYADRIWALTQTHLHPSLRRNPDTFAPSQVIRVADPGEIAYWVKKAFGGLYVGTSKDIYRIDGTGDELADGTIDFRKIQLNVDAVPVASNAVTSDGNIIIYLASDGWRKFAGGADSVRLAEDTELLWQGNDRHGVSKINIDSPLSRFFACLADNSLYSMVPEGSNTTSTPVLYRFDLKRNRWYRRVYFINWRSIFAEGDGTLLAGGTDGSFWQLNVPGGGGDNNIPIPIRIQSKIEDAEMPLRRKDPFDFHSRMNTGGIAAQTTIVGYVGTVATQASVFTVAAGQADFHEPIDSIGPALQFQVLIEGSFFVFKLYEWSIHFRERTQLLMFSENRPLQLSTKRSRFGGLTVSIDTLGLDAKVTPVLDNVDLPPFFLNSSDLKTQSLTFQSVVGRDLWARIESLGLGYELYQLSPIVLNEFPQPFQGLVAATNAGHPCEKVMSGIRVRLNTLGAPTEIFPMLDGVAEAPFLIQNSGDDGKDFILNFTSPKTATEIAFRATTPIELYEWAPVVLYTNPCHRRVWDSGPVDIPGKDTVWIREIRVKAKALANLLVTPHFDGVPHAPYTATVVPGLVDVYPVPVGREYKGRVPRIVVTSTQDFNPYWVEFWFRQTGGATEKKPYRVKAS